MKATHMRRVAVNAGEFPYQSFDDIPLYNQRYLPRWYTTNKAFYRIDGDNRIFVTQTRNINAMGVSLVASQDIKASQHLSMKLYLSEDSSVRAQGVVMWKKKGADFTTIGVAFEHLDRKAQEAILDRAFQF